MTRPLVIRPAAEQDMAEARAWYEDRQAGLGDEFLAALDVVFARIGDAPEAYAVEYRNVRRVGLSRFPYVVYYRLTASAVEVMAVLHGSRDPRTWKGRS